MRIVLVVRFYSRSNRQLEAIGSVGQETLDDTPATDFPASEFPMVMIIPWSRPPGHSAPNRNPFWYVVIVPINTATTEPYEGRDYE